MKRLAQTAVAAEEDLEMMALPCSTCSVPCHLKLLMPSGVVHHHHHRPLLACCRMTAMVVMSMSWLTPWRA
jgi:hypothetical protein